MGVGKLNHVAIAVPDLQQASALYRDVMGAEVSEPAVRLPILLLPVRIEMIESLLCYIATKRSWRYNRVRKSG